jgi:hypothetical protein
MHKFHTIKETYYVKAEEKTIYMDAMTHRKRRLCCVCVKCEHKEAEYTVSMIIDDRKT